MIILKSFTIGNFNMSLKIWTPKWETQFRTFFKNFFTLVTIHIFMPTLGTLLLDTIKLQALIIKWAFSSTEILYAVNYIIMKYWFHLELKKSWLEPIQVLESQAY